MVVLEKLVLAPGVKRLLKLKLAAIFTSFSLLPPQNEANNYVLISLKIRKLFFITTCVFSLFPGLHLLFLALLHIWTIAGHPFSSLAFFSCALGCLYVP